MIERALYSVLAAGRDLANEDPDFLKDFFGSITPALSDAEIEQITTYWNSVEAIDPDGTEKTGVSILHNFPRDTAKFPCWSIVLLTEGESTQVLGDEAGYIGEDGEDILTSFWDKSYAVFIYARHSLICLYYYELVRFFLTRGRPYLKSEDGGDNLSIKFSGGDMAPDPRYAPADLFVRRFQIDVMKEEQVSGTPQIRGTKVRGMHLDDIEGVTANITVTTGEDEDGDEEG